MTLQSVIHLRILQAEKDAWSHAAAARGLSLSQLIRSLVNDVILPDTPQPPPRHLPPPTPKTARKNPLCERCERLGPPPRPCPNCHNSSLNP